MCLGIIPKGDALGVQVPVFLIFGDVTPENRFNGPIEPLCLPVSLGVVGRSENVPCAESLAHRLEEFSDKLGTIVRE